MIAGLPSEAVKKDSTSLPSGQSLFFGHDLPVKNNYHTKQREKGYDGFFSVILLAGFILFVIVRVFSPRKLNQLFLAFIKPAAMNQLLREESALSGRTSILLLFIFILIVPLFVLQSFLYFTHNSFLILFPHSSGIIAYALIAVVLAGAYLMKITSIRLFSFMFGLRTAASEYIYTILLYNKIAGLLLFPLVLLIAFGRQLNPVILLYPGLAFLGILLIYRFLRLIQIGMPAAGVSIFYLFLYLCTLEILPFVVLIKLFMFSFS